MNITADFAAGKITKTQWVQVLGYQPEKESVAKHFGQMYGVISITSEIDFDLGNLGGFLLDEVQNSYYTRESGLPGIDDFEAAFFNVKARLDEILSREEELAKTGIDLEFAVAVVKEEVIYLGIVGEAKAYISRGEDFAEIGGALIDSQMEGFVRTGSLYIQPEDRILLATNHVSQVNSESSIREVMAGFAFADLFVKKGTALLIGYELDEDTLASIAEHSAPVDEEVEVSADVTDMDPDLAPKETEVNVRLVEHIELDEVSAEDEEQEPMMATSEIEDDEDEDLDEQTEVWDTDVASVSNKDESAEPEGTGDFIDDTFTYNLKGQGERIAGHAKRYAGKAAGHVTSLISTAKSKVSASRAAGASRVSLDEINDSGDEVGVVDKVKDLAAGAISQIQGFIKGGVGDRRELYLKGGKSGRNWRAVSVIVLVIVVILFLGIRKLAQDREREAHIREVETQISELQNTRDQLNVEVTALSIATGQEAAKQSAVVELAKLKSDAEALLPEEIKVSDLESIIDFATNSQDDILNIRGFTEPQVVSDLGANFEQTDLADMEYSEGNLYVADEARGVVYRVATALGSEAGVFASGFTQPYLLGLDEDGDLVVVDRNADNPVISTVNKSNGEIYRHPGLSLARIGELGDIDIWSNAALYSISPTKNAVVKQENVGGNYQLPNDAAPWASDPSLSQAIDVEVDWWLYALVKGEGLKRYLGGQPVTYTYINALLTDQEAIKEATALHFTSTHFYIGDSKNNRVLVFQKNLENEEQFILVEQYVYRGEESILSDIKEIVVNEAAGQIFVLDGSRIIRLDK